MFMVSTEMGVFMVVVGNAGTSVSVHRAWAGPGLGAGAAAQALIAPRPGPPGVQVTLSDRGLAACATDGANLVAPQAMGGAYSMRGVRPVAHMNTTPALDAALAWYLFAMLLLERIGRPTP
jgi:hypothetical protein